MRSSMRSAVSKAIEATRRRSGEAGANHVSLAPRKRPRGYAIIARMNQAARPHLTTVGHSNRSGDGFIELLERAGIEWLIDIRSYPRSRRVPWFARERLREQLADAGIGYSWWGRAFGGKRRLSDMARSRHPALPEGLAAFAEHMRSAAFEHAAVELIRAAGDAAVGLMCAERDPVYCHRWLLADRLMLVDGLTVVHWLDTPDHCYRHWTSASARRDDDGHVRYDAGRTAGLLGSD